MSRVALAKLPYKPFEQPLVPWGADRKSGTLRPFPLILFVALGQRLPLLDSRRAARHF